MVKHRKELVKVLTCSRSCDYRVYGSDIPLGVSAKLNGFLAMKLYSTWTQPFSMTLSTWLAPCNVFAYLASLMSAVPSWSLKAIARLKHWTVGDTIRSAHSY